jgi:Zn-dependent M28 family amino/carboxypeptidase
MRRLREQIAVLWVLSVLGSAALASGDEESINSNGETLFRSTMVERLRRHVQHLADDIGERNVFHPEALQAGADYIRSEWGAQGYEVLSQSYEAEGVSSENLEVRITGRSRPAEIILIGAHYDSVWGSPGANDNASGVAALLELSRAFRVLSPERSVRFAAFVNEEPPFFMSRRMGSSVYAKAARSRGEDIVLMISLEMLGCYSEEPGSQRYPPLFKYFYPDQGNFIAFVSNLRSRRLLHRTVGAFRAHSDFPVESLATFTFVPGVAWSDQWSFWRQGYAALMVTDTAFYRYPYYHTALDTPDKLNYPAMAQVVEGLFGAIRSLALE